MRQFLMQIPREISDAARIDGASEFRIFYQIVLPQALPALGVISIFAGLFAWNDFLGPLIYLQDETMYTLSIGLTFFKSQREMQFSLLMAASTLVVLPVVALFLLFQRSFVEGISLGSVK
jgi:multiple sugar transport system permease protein